jgi:hypothetical protein
MHVLQGSQHALSDLHKTSVVRDAAPVDLCFVHGPAKCIRRANRAFMRIYVSEEQEGKNGNT